MKSHRGRQDARFLDADGVYGLLDRLSRAILGMDAGQFARAYSAGQLDRRPIAHDLAKLLPFATPASARLDNVN
jgi:hypothetical protein